MKSSIRIPALALSFVALLACASGTNPNTPANTGGSVGTGGSATGGSATGGSATGGSATGGSTTTGGANSGGRAETGGSASGGTSTGGARTGGTATGGASSTGGMSGGGGSGMTSATALPSPGCSKGTARPTNGMITVDGDHIYTFPASYDGKTPFPLLLGLHACGNPIDQIKTLTDGSSLANNYVRIFPKAAGSCWEYPAEVMSKVYKVFDEITASYCIDLNRVFGTGHSSGAQLLQQIISNAQQAKHFNFRAVAPDAASAYGPIQGPLPAMYIQGSKDTQRGNGDGKEVVALYLTGNMCQSTSMAYTTGVDACKSSGGQQVNAGCVVYDGCKVPTIWCSHNDPDYNNTNHGWPCFATKAMATFFDSFK